MTNSLRGGAHRERTEERFRDTILELQMSILLNCYVRELLMNVAVVGVVLFGLLQMPAALC